MRPAQTVARALRPRPSFLGTSSAARGTALLAAAAHSQRAPAALPNPPIAHAAPMSSTAARSSPAAPEPESAGGPLESSMRAKLLSAFAPVSSLRIRNDSAKHAHHAAMVAARASSAGGEGGRHAETHFHVELISEAFEGTPALARHRKVNALLQEEFDTMGLHALSLRLKTPKEVEKEMGRQ